MVDVNRFKSMQSPLASLSKVRSWSYGEVKNLKQSITVLETKNVKDSLMK